MEEITLQIGKSDNLFALLDKNQSRIEKIFNITISRRGDKLMFDGDLKSRKLFKKFFSSLLKVADVSPSFNGNDFKISLNMVKDGNIKLIETELLQSQKIVLNGKSVFPKTFNQKTYIKAAFEHDLTFAIGPAGTGKTFLAVAIALHHLLSKKLERIVLTRPVVEAGENLGFLPGDIQQKVNPYFRPLYDALYYLIGFEKTSELIEKEIIEVAPLAYMRGRTINDAFIILDEGQNTTNSQMQMFLTRFGSNSRVIVTADITQIDLQDRKKSGIFRAKRILENIDGIKMINLKEKDVVRHDLVRKIIKAYEKEKK
ncbi:MAG: PhoH family protein [Candidatus Aminicenantes bacterium]|nr:PhoH family protein [Candidatus Aminicenantes bacterium]